MFGLVNIQLSSNLRHFDLASDPLIAFHLHLFPNLEKKQVIYVCSVKNL
jgi:hypothetical protein